VNLAVHGGLPGAASKRLGTVAPPIAVAEEARPMVRASRICFIGLS
jgi:hypothetical protein